MAKIYLPLIIFLLLFSCKNADKENGSVANVTDSSDNTVTKPIIVIHRAKIQYTGAQQPIAVKALPPRVFSANANVIKVEGELTSSDVPNEIKSITPGTDTFPLPKIITLKTHTVTCKQPLPLPALSPRFKDAAISDIQYLDVDQGMSSSFIKSVMSDHIGNLWFGTNGGGVSRYDGKSFEHFTEKNGLSNNKVLTILQDHSGKIWFGTEGGGACCYNGDNFLWITEEEGLGNNTVLSLCEDKAGNMWFGTNGSGVYKFDGKTLTAYTEKEGLSNGSVRSIIQDHKGNMWFGTTGSGACMFNGKSFTNYGETEGLNSSIIHSIIESKDGKIYFATEDGGVNVFDGKTVKYITAKRGLSSNCVVSLHEDKLGNIWIGTYDSGLCKYDGNEITVFSTGQGLTNNYILAMCEDNSGSIWLGTLGGGVCRFNNGSFTHYTQKEGIGSNTVRSITQDSKGNLWMGTFGDGAIYYNGNSFSHYAESEGMPSARIKATLTDNEDVWFGTEENGAVRFNGKTFENFTKAQGLNSNYILSMCRDKNGRIWFGTDEGGVCCYDGTQFLSLIDEEDLSTGIIPAIMQDRSGNMWFGTDGSGVCCYDGKFLKWYTTRTGLCSNVIKYIYEDKEGNIWFGSDGKGISILKAKTINTSTPVFETLSQRDGLSSNQIRSVIQDTTGNFWIATEMGLNYVINKNGKKIIHVYTSADGLKANNFYYTTLIDKNNTIWWGNGKALTNLNLNNYKLPEAAPLIQLSGLVLEQTFIDFHSLRDTLKTGRKVQVGDKDKKDLTNVEFTGVESFYNYPVDLSLPYNINHLEFQYSAIDWAAADKIRYKFMLSGSDEEWSPLTQDNKASYNNLPHGKYIFKVKAIGVSGKWSKVFEYPFTIRAPWYLTIWAYSLYIIAFFAVVVGFNNIRTRQLKVRQQELENTVAERTAEVVEQKELIEEKQKEIVDSINYAKRIQSAMLASEQLFTKNLKNYFVLFEPKDIVSGDFYWASALVDGRFALVTADSTGHGVPGAMMCMLNISCLNEAVNERKYTSAAAILDHARQRIISSLAEDGSEEGGKDGMDCSVTIFDFANKKLTYAAANNPVWIFRKNDETGAIELLELKPDRMPVGKHAKDNVPFTEKIIDLKSGDVVYTLTDGYCDQFGGPRQKKFTYKRLKEILAKISAQSPKEQKAVLQKTFEEWRGTQEQVDDVLIIGVMIG
ncbi:MAG: rsbU 7 [Bacteroidetes bacterium]|nr:rsbU 7 [Bacteroidota bacterium]